MFPMRSHVDIKLLMFLLRPTVQVDIIYGRCLSLG